MLCYAVNCSALLCCVLLYRHRAGRCADRRARVQQCYRLAADAQGELVLDYEKRRYKEMCYSECIILWHILVCIVLVWGDVYTYILADCLTGWLADCGQVVSGRLVNCYKTDDWMLGLMWRSKAWQVGVAGLGPVLLHEEEGEEKEEVVNRGDNSSSNSREEGGGSGPSLRSSHQSLSLSSSAPTPSALLLRTHDPAWRTAVENIDISDLVPSHLLYAECLRAVMLRVGLTEQDWLELLTVE